MPRDNDAPLTYPHTWEKTGDVKFLDHLEWQEYACTRCPAKGKRFAGNPTIVLDGIHRERYTCLPPGKGD